jgi:cobalt-precorrin 5A hydrolase
MGGGETVLVIGIGSTSRATIEDVMDVVVAALDWIERARGEAARHDLIYIATLDRPQTNPVFQEAAEKAGLPIRLIAADELRAAAPRCITYSKRSMRTHGIPSVAEAAALAALGPDAKILVPRFFGENTTASVAYIP